MSMMTRNHRQGFSIIELIVVIGVVMVLMGIFLPALSGTRQTEQKTKLASQVRQMATMIAMYCDSQNDFYPVADDRFWFSPALGPGESPPYEDGRWWGYPLIDLGYFTVEQVQDRDYLDATNQQLSIAMCYDPAKMRPDTIEDYEDRYTSGIRQSSARYPSGKGMLWTPIVSYTPELRYWCCTQIDPPGPVAFADGSVETVAWHELPTPGSAPILGIGKVVSSTWNGIYGKDR